MKKIIICICILLVIVIAIVSNIIESDLDGKTIAFLGDSLMEGIGNDSNAFEYYFKSYLPNSKLINCSKSGATITSNTGTDDIVIFNQIKNLTDNPDIIIFDGGANDIISYGLGFLDNSLKKEIGILNSEGIPSNNSVIEDFEKIVLELKNKFPNSKLCYLQLFLIDDDTIDHITLDESKKPEMKSRRDELFKQIKVLCEKLDVKYIDVSNKLIGTENKYRQEGYIHLKEEGYKLLTPYILEELKK